MYKRDFSKFTMKIFLCVSILFAAFYFEEIYFHDKSTNYGSSYFYPTVEPAMRECGVDEPMEFYAQNALVLYLVDSSENWKHVSEDDVRTVFFFSFSCTN